MAVNIDKEDRTWQIHLDGLLNLLPRMSGFTETVILSKAMEIFESGQDIGETLASTASSRLDTAYLLLDLTKLRLRKILFDMGPLFSPDTTTPRKIDIQRSRILYKRLYRDLSTFLSLISAQAHISTALGNEQGVSSNSRYSTHTNRNGKMKTTI
jgi:hypothetical protein